MELIPGFDPYIGAQIADYKLEGLVGRGGMSLVYRARQQHLDRIVALKLLSPELARDERFRQRFIRESRIAASLDHPNIIPIYDAGETQGLLYIAMRFVDGRTLAEMLEQSGALSVPLTLSIIEQIGGALDVAHAAGLVHRDVKPENILITETGDGLDRVFLSDFGLTKHPNTSGTTRSGELMGTVGYVAPEQIEGKPPTGQTDIYSLGCVLYQCLTGFRPFDLDSEIATLWAHLHKPAPLVSDRRPDLPAAIDRVVGRALAKDGRERYETAGVLAAAAREALPVEASAGAGQTSPLPASRRARRPAPLLLGAGAIAVVALLVLVARELTSTPVSRASIGHPPGQQLPTRPLNRSVNATTYRNPIVVRNAPAPTIISAGGIFYAYTTQSVYDQRIHIPVMASRDLVDWGYLGDALPKLPSWVDHHDPDTWAPDVVRIGDHYNLYFTERIKPGAMAIATATSSRPQGPFTVQGGPLLQARGFRDADASVLRDPSGQLFLYWGAGKGPIKVLGLSPQGTATEGVAHAALRPSDVTSYDRSVAAPAVIHRGVYYYLFYSGTRCCRRHAHDAVLVARSPSPLGPFTRAPTNPIIAANDRFTAPGHGSIFRDESGAYFILYQALKRLDTTRLRYLMLDRVEWRAGWPVVNDRTGPSFTPQPRPQVGT